MNSMASEHDTSPGIVLTDEQKRKRRNRSVALGLCIGGLVVLFYAITVVKMGPAILSRAM